MRGVPIFVEVDSTRLDKDLQVCSKIVTMLTESNFGPVGLAGTIPELQSILGELSEHKLTPGIFAINTFGVKPILPELDNLMGDAPVIYFRRELFAGQSGLMEHMGVSDAGTQNTVVVLGKMRPRLTAFCFYGKKNAQAVAKDSFATLTRFLNGEDFRLVEQMGARFGSDFSAGPAQR